MKAIALLLLLALAASASAQTPQAEQFSYQGYLELNGQPANGSFPMAFKLFDAASGGNQIGSTLNSLGIEVTGGAFGVLLGWPSAFTGNQLWLETSVNGQTITPREKIVAAPVAQFALNGSRTLYYNEPNPDPVASPVQHLLASAGPFEVYESCFIDGSGTVSARLLVNTDNGYDIRELLTGQTNDAGAVSYTPASAFQPAGLWGLGTFIAAAGDYRRGWGTYIVHATGSSPPAVMTITAYSGADARVGSTNCTFEGTLTLGM